MNPLVNIALTRKILFNGQDPLNLLLQQKPLRAFEIKICGRVCESLAT